MKSILYIFLHVPKTGGSTMKQHIIQNFKKDEVFLFDYKVWKNKGGIKPIFDNLTDQQKKRIKIILGHGAYYGVHKFFDKEPRYILFLRSPINRVLSSYNYNIDEMLKKKRKKERLDEKLKHMLKNNRIISFLDFVRYENLNNFVTKFLIIQLFNQSIKSKDLRTEIRLTKVRKKDFKKIKEYLKKFYFIGMTENQEDFLFVYYLLGIRKFYFNQNISKKHFILQNKAIKKEIVEKNKWDIKVYKYGLELNKKFKQTFNFEDIVLKIKIKRILLIFFVDFCRIIKTNVYRSSYYIRQKSKFYSRFVDYVKGKLK